VFELKQKHGKDKTTAHEVNIKQKETRGNQEALYFPHV